MTKRAPAGLWCLLAIAAGGVGVSTYLTRHYYQLRDGRSPLHSICNLGAGMDCDVVAASRYAEVIPGFPLSSFAGGAFLAIGVLAALAFAEAKRRAALRWVLGLSAAGTVVSAGYFFVMTRVLGNFCVFCFATDILILAALACVLALRGHWSGAAPASSTPRLWAWAGGSLVVALLGFKLLDKGYSVSAAEAEEMFNNVMERPVLAVGAGPELPSFGKADAPITLVEFSDYQCPFCRIGAQMVNGLVNRFPGKIRVVFRNFPLDSSCNRSVTSSMHELACQAARIGSCAWKAGRFQSVYEAFFHRQEEFAHASDASALRAIATDAGLSPGALDGCESSGEARMAVERDIEEGLRLGVGSTPTFYVNGRKVIGFLPMKAWDLIVAKLLADAPPVTAAGAAK